MGTQRTNGLKEGIALVEDEELDLLEIEGLLVGEGQEATGGTDHNVRGVLLERSPVLRDGETPKEHRCLDVGHVLGEATEPAAT